MKRRMLSTIGIGAAMAMALASSPAQSYVNSPTQTVKEVKATLTDTKKAKTKLQKTIGGVPLESYVPNYGMSPKEYGMRFGNGKSRNGKINRDKISHQSKIRARRA